MNLLNRTQSFEALCHLFGTGDRERAASSGSALWTEAMVPGARSERGCLYQKTFTSGCSVLFGVGFKPIANVTLVTYMGFSQEFQAGVV